ncbi:metalloproteinase inhibitor 2-like [Syngnathoides biaculeatus]|uniref:metalloproteinase inhibitor 2-like n=1 Tax=Syngnathoides biaculeatus TaxID=300417 RepID=UPI002ADDB7E5|nr:metalloproteinase inhibitor 2-like [Syngnathoides biaculeatus]
MFRTLKVLVLPLVLLCSWKEAQGCSCAATHPQQAFCQADVVIKAKVVGGKADGDFIKPIKYDIKQTKMFKGPDKDFDAIYTAPTSSLCGVTLAKGIEYLIAGRLESDGSLHVTLCNFLEPWDVLSATQKKSLVQRYQMGCDCKITRCTSVPCGISSPAECLWTDYLTEKMTNGKQARHFACIMRSDGSCAWYRGAASPKKEFMDIEDP